MSLCSYALAAFYTFLTELGQNVEMLLFVKKSHDSSLYYGKKARSFLICITLFSLLLKWMTALQGASRAFYFDKITYFIYRTTPIHKSTAFVNNSKDYLLLILICHYSTCFMHHFHRDSAHLSNLAPVWHCLAFWHHAVDFGPRIIQFILWNVLNVCNSNHKSQESPTNCVYVCGINMISTFTFTEYEVVWHLHRHEWRRGSSLQRPGGVLKRVSKNFRTQ